MNIDTELAIPNMNIDILKLIIVLSLSFSSVLGFFPNVIPGVHYTTKSHRDITFTGISRAIATFIVDRNLTQTSSLSSSIDDFFGNDLEQKSKLYQRIDEIAVAIGDTQSRKKLIPYVHCHAEEIELAHNHIISCKAGLEIRKNDLTELRRHLGECLYTIQSFYSNTNWVEMNGNVPYLDFGVKGKVLMPIASFDEDTCKDIPPGNDCQNNILVSDKLTSGYHQGWGQVKPARPNGATAGKCSHGGPLDSGRTLVARCGINKDSTIKGSSPHHHLHVQAYEAAVEATKQFFVNKDTGVIDTILGDELFRDVLNIRTRQRKSLAFAVDYSGSMGDEIEGVKEEIIQLVTSTMGSDNEPADYVLSLFNDPAIGLSRKFSNIIVFTDADAKDSDRFNEIIKAAVQKNIIITSLITGTCSRRRRSLKDRFRRDTTLFFERIAGSTYGKVYTTDKANVAQAISEVIQTVFPTSELDLETTEWIGCSSSKPVFVDDSLTVLKVKVQRSLEITDVDLYWPNGTQYMFPSTTGTKIFSWKRQEIIFSLQNPGAGTFELRCNRESTYNVVITSQSSVGITVGMYATSNDGTVSTLNGSPVVEWNNLTSPSGALISSYTTDGGVSEFELLCSTEIVVPNQVFQVKVNVSDADDSVLLRTYKTVYRPTNVELLVSPFTSDGTLGKEYTVPYTIKNTGTNNDTYTVTIQAVGVFILGSGTYQLSVLPEDEVDGNFTLLPNVSTGNFPYIVQMINMETKEEVQRFTGNVIVTSIERPICTVTISPELCPSWSLNTANCSKRQWTAIAKIDFQGTELGSLTNDGGDGIVMTHDNISAVLSGPIQANISGDCCIPMLTINAVDKDGYIAQCNLDLSNGKPIEPAEQVQEPVTEVVTATEVEPVTEVVSVTEVVPVTKVVTATEVEPVTEVVPVTKVVSVTEVEPVTEVVSDTEVVPVTKVVTATEVEPVTEVVSVTEVVPVTKVVTATEVEPVTEVVSDTEVVPVTKVVTATEVEPVTEVVSDTEVVPVTKVVTATEVDPVTHQKRFSETFTILVAAVACFVLLIIVISVTIIALRFMKGKRSNGD